MVLRSAGLVPFHRGDGTVHLFLVHMGGPLWGHRDVGAWSIAKGLYDPATEPPEDAALREFTEEVGIPAPPGDLLDLGEVRQRSGKLVRAFGVEADRSLCFVRSNTFTLEWPRGSGRIGEYPEVDAAAWLDEADARARIIPGQVPFLDALAVRLAEPQPPDLRRN